MKWKFEVMTQWISVSSDAISRIGYDADTKQMHIDFHDSRPTYTYCSVPKEVFNQFVSADSVGTHYHQYIKDNYNC